MSDLTDEQRNVLRAVRAAERAENRVPSVVSIAYYVDMRVGVLSDLLRDLAVSSHLERVTDYPVRGYRITAKGRAAVPLERSYRATITGPDILDAATLDLIAALVREHTGAALHVHSDVTEF